MFKIALTHLQDTAEVERQFIPKGSKLEILHSVTEEELIKNLQDFDATISAYEPFTRRVIESLPKLKVISQAATGFNTIDMEAASERGIAVINNPDYCTPEVADHTMAMILALDRRLIEFNKMTQVDREWKYDLITDITRFSEQVLGLYGLGTKARAVAKRAHAFGIKIIATDPYINIELAKELNVEMVTFEELIERSDIISIHAPLTDETENSISMETFKRMKKNPIIINTGRGAIIDEDDLVEALDLGLIRGAALDVLKDEEPDLRKSKLIGRDNLILTPHIAYYSETSQYEIQKKSAENISLYLEGRFDELNIVNGVKRKI